MDSLNSNGPGALALEPLCQGAAQELLMRSYTIRTVNRYKQVWKQLADFVRAQGPPAEYTRELALRFEQAYGVRDGEVLKHGQQWRRHLVFGIKVLDDFARTGTISRFVVETTGLRVPAGMHKPLRSTSSTPGAAASSAHQPGRADAQHRGLPGLSAHSRPGDAGRPAGRTPQRLRSDPYGLEAEDRRLRLVQREAVPAVPVHARHPAA